jgi:hypothetical protein
MEKKTDASLDGGRTALPYRQAQRPSTVYSHSVKIRLVQVWQTDSSKV